MDLMLDDIIGVKTIEMVKKSSPDSAIIVMVNDSKVGFAKRALKAGAHEFLLKSANNNLTLRNAISSAMLRKEYERRIYEKVNFDSLTSFPNFRVFDDHLEIELAKAKKHKKKKAVMMVEICNHEKMHEKFGSQVSDQLVKSTSKRIKEALCQTDFISRYSSSEFAVIPDIEDDINIKSECAKIAGNVIRKMFDPIVYYEEEFFVSINIGFAIFPQDGQALQDVIDASRDALNNSKKTGNDSFKFA